MSKENNKEEYAEGMAVVASMYQTVANNLKALSNTISTKETGATPEELEIASGLLKAASTYQKVVDELKTGESLTELKKDRDHGFGCYNNYGSLFD